jgi:serine/threonine protein kinase
VRNRFLKCPSLFYWTFSPSRFKTPPSPRTGQTPFYVEEALSQPAQAQQPAGGGAQAAEKGEEQQQGAGAGAEGDKGGSKEKEAHKGREEIYARITGFDGALRYVRDDVSAAARDFITALVDPDPRARISLDEALAHPWLASAVAAAAAAAAAGAAGRGAERRKS